MNGLWGVDELGEAEVGELDEAGGVRRRISGVGVSRGGTRQRKDGLPS